MLLDGNMFQSNILALKAILKCVRSSLAIFMNFLICFMFWVQMLGWRTNTVYTRSLCSKNLVKKKKMKTQNKDLHIWVGREREHIKGLKRGLHFYHMPYCVNICMSLLKVFRRWAGHQLLVSCSSSRHLLPQSINQSVQWDILPLLDRMMQTTALAEMQW